MLKENDKRQIDEDDLDEVTGGAFTPALTLEGCEYFYQATGKGTKKTCKNCFYYHVVNKIPKCTEPRKANKEESFI